MGIFEILELDVSLGLVCPFEDLALYTDNTWAKTTTCLPCVVNMALYDGDTKAKALPHVCDVEMVQMLMWWLGGGKYSYGHNLVSKA